MEVRALDDSELGSWDELVDSSVQGTVFQKSDWLLACMEEYGVGLKIYGCFDRDELIGGCPVYVKSRALLKEAFSSLNSMTCYGGVVLSAHPGKSVRSRESRERAIISTLITAIDADSYHRIVLKNSIGLKDVRPFTMSRWTSQIAYTYILDLEKLSPDSFERAARRCIEKGSKNGFTVRKKSDPLAYYQLFEAMLSGKGIKPFASQSLFDNLLNDRLNPIAEMWVAEAPTGEIASSKIITYDGKRAYMWSESTHPEFKGTGSNCLLEYEVLKDLAARGFGEADLTRANIPELATFASQLNPELVPYYTVETSRAPVSIASALYRALV